MADFLQPSPYRFQRLDEKKMKIKKKKVLNKTLSYRTINKLTIHNFRIYPRIKLIDLQQDHGFNLVCIHQPGPGRKKKNQNKKHFI